MPHLTLAGCELYYETHGQGEPLILIAGLGGDVGSWQCQLPQLSKHFQCIVLDNRGAGRSQQTVTEPLSLVQMAADVIALLDHLAIDRAHVVGFSMGGRIAQHLALQHPDRINKLVLAATAAFRVLRSAYLFNAFAQLNLEQLSIEARVRLMLPWMFSAEFFNDEAKVQALLAVKLMRSDGFSLASFAAQYRAVYEDDGKIDVTGIKPSTLVLVGDQDLVTPPACSQHLAERLPEAQLQQLPGGHCIHVECAEAFNGAILEFLNA